MVQITIQTAQTVMACRNLRYLNYFTVTGGERFYYVFERFFIFPLFIGGATIEALRLLPPQIMGP